MTAAPRPGDLLVNPVTGQALRFLRTGAETGGALLEVDSTWAPNGSEPLAHRHPRQAERFTVVRGVLRVRVDGAVRDLRAGDTLDVPPGVPHGMWNASGAPTTARWETRPALGTGRMLAALWRLAARGDAGAGRLRRVLDLALFLVRFRGEFRVALPGPAARRAVRGPSAGGSRRRRGAWRRATPSAA